VGLATSLASALAFNFFFLPPEHTLVINSSSDWLALASATGCGIRPFCTPDDLTSWHRRRSRWV